MVERVAGKLSFTAARRTLKYRTFWHALLRSAYLLSFAKVVNMPGAWAMARRWPRTLIPPGHRYAMARAILIAVTSLLMRASIIHAGQPTGARFSLAMQASVKRVLLTML